MSHLDRRLILRNTILLYGRMLLTVWLNLWATRLTLRHLGVDDLGVYGVVGSVVTMTGVLTGGITHAVQRSLTFELGRGAEGRTGQVFGASLSLLLVVAAVLVALAEALGPWVLRTRLDIPAASLGAAQWVFQFMVVALVANLIAVPYNALVIAHERMGAFAAISVLQVALHCAAAWSLSLLAEGRLAFYGGAMALIAVLVRLAYGVYCRRHFPEAQFRWGLRGADVRALARFAGVATLSGVMLMLSGEGIMLVINVTFGVAVNAVYAIALQAKNMVLSFALNVFKAIQPQITKTYAEGDYAAHTRLVCMGSKVEVCLILVVMLPMLCRTEQLLGLWLGPVPAHGVAFVRGALFLSLTYSAFEPIRTAVLATGRIARFMLIPEAFYLLVLPVGYGVARLTGSPDRMLYAVVAMDVLACVWRVGLGVRVSPLRAGQLLRQVVLPCLVVGGADAAVCHWLSGVLPTSLTGLGLLVVLNGAALVALIVLLYHLIEHNDRLP